ncbi:hypothetical protein [Parabacteroides distasonis]|uniref:hypothetical protein n=1 Tax=Parabacteroides distasonis TaxID=823 RepID=UPI0018AC8013|nr:hypothetical protein [Parabacteroides distasonis]MDB9026809.1 hypothetical protein [Parabacteroides distasonis]MDB9043553.1 hypothetical protein [Parabacteroides distasonis]MDB9093462.1 hypothetical protein [Parabacteroides distasonis]MDB9161673.1 hypothetical protein [Parabacteroides distasonis]
MNVPINISSIDSLKYSLYTSAKVLNSVWNDKQYDYFIEHYVRPITDEVQGTTSRLNEEIFSLRNAVEELENLASEY